MPATSFGDVFWSGCPDDNGNSNSIVLIVQKIRVLHQKVSLSSSAPRRRLSDVLSRVRAFRVSALKDVDNSVRREL